MYSLAPKATLNPKIVEYIAGNEAATIGYDNTAKCYVCASEGTFGGLLSALKKYYYPAYPHTRRKHWKTQKMSSTKAQGITVDKQIARWTKNPAIEPVHIMAKALVAHFKKIGHIPQVAQLPVNVSWPMWGTRYTQADLITADSKTGELTVWEIKTGAPPGGSIKKGVLNHAPKVPNTIFNHWQLQCHYTATGLIRAGLPIVAHNIIQVYMTKKDDNIKIHVKVRPPEKWTAYLK